MDNLKLQSCHHIKHEQFINNCHIFTVNNDLNIIYLVNNANDLISIDCNNELREKCCNLCDCNDVKAIHIEYMYEENNVCIALSNGDIICYNQITKCKQLAKQFDGLECVQFSFDQELIVLLTVSQQLILMTKLFDITCEHDLNAKQFGINELVSVNWGSKQTQFHGQGRKHEMNANNGSNQCFNGFGAQPSSDTNARISWRGDDLYFVTSSVDRESECYVRKLRIWNREGVLCYTCQDINGLESLVSWKPSGNLIASSQRSPDKHNIIFFEKNGLKHEEFELPFSSNSFRIERILWSYDSEILLIVGHECIEQTSTQILMLWTQSNYHWYLKQTLKFNERQVIDLLWNSTDYTKLHVLFNDGVYGEYRWNRFVDECNGIIGIIDGNQLNVTDFNLAIVPQPFFMYCLHFKSQIVQICFSKESNFIVILNDDTTLYFKSGINDCNNDDLSILYTSKEVHGSVTFHCSQANQIQGISSILNLILNDCKIFGIDMNNYLVFYDFRNDCNEMSKLLRLDNKVSAMDCESEVIAITYSNGTLYKCNTNECIQWFDNNNREINSSEKCNYLKLIKIENDLHSILLCEDLTLYIDNHVITQNNCNSFTVFNDSILLYTTTDHLLKILPLDKAFDIIDRQSVRNIERGAKIISTCINDGKLILSMPRGNLEVIYPRLILLNVVMTKLDKLQYDIAFELLRKHKINVNFLHDYNPVNFKQNLSIIIKQIGERNIQWLCLFLSELSEENCYSKLCGDSNDSIIADNNTENNKVNSICDSMRDIMNQFDSIKYLHPILLTYIKKSLPEIENALIRIKKLENNCIRDEALKFLLYSIDINVLFDEALGTYDFDLLLMVAAKSNKDPKEYLALIDELKNYETEDYRRYKIDMQLKRYKKALSHISKLEHHFEECLDLIRNQSLYRDAIILFENKTNEHKNQVWKAYGEYLLSKKYFEESAIAFKRCNDYVNAVKCFQLSGNWNAALTTASKCSHVISIEQLSRSLAKNLALNGKYTDSAYLLEYYANDPNEAIKTLICGHEWPYALRLIDRFPKQNEDYLNLYQLLQFELKSFYETTLDNILSFYNSIMEFKNRLDVVLLNKIKNNENTKTFDNIDYNSEAYSDTNSLSDSSADSSKHSNTSLQTRKSKKLTKKSENRKYVWKKGSAFEDVQIIYGITEIIKNVDRMQEYVSLLIKTLYELNFVSESRQLQHQFKKLLEIINTIINEIWNQNGKQLVINENHISEKYATIFKSNPELKIAPLLRKIDWKLIII